jgi:hypothetical protein
LTGREVILRLVSSLDILKEDSRRENMQLREYLEKTEGVGVLATADSSGKVDAAIYARPHILEDGTAAFIMRDRLTHHNLQSNPHAVYLFLQQGAGYRGKRLFLTKTREEKDSELLQTLHRRNCPVEDDKTKGPQFLVMFTIDRELPLVGAGDK